ncbi:hypothetical protein SAMD00023353_0501490 [Rosellinia necatrix]|uniref:Uncharacterized protein n=1 Tax=Rosellinia necatrix TaxID=77044 RepID=A0A1S7UMT3_ROSNE|nr:hypothetical protein SAMD00023353_0501490 [Rosellinia necatrix]
MSGRSPIGRPITGRPRRSLAIEKREDQDSIQTRSCSQSPHNCTCGEDHATFVPEVPRIPNRFRPNQKDGDSNLVQELAQSPKDEEKPGSESVPAPHTRYLPNCSFGKPKEVQVISNAMMQAYITMRGNFLGREDKNDPLFEWIQRREELAGANKPKVDQKRDIARMLQLIDKALESSNMGGDSPRDCVFEVYRPDFEHIKPPQDMDMSANIFAACCTDFEWNDDSDSDEEAGVPSGRISPCTFLQWSTGCVRWNADENENKKDTAAYRRMRPPTPKFPVPPRQYRRASIDTLEPQWDVYTGEELTPAYYVPTSPSIIYTPPGVEFTGFKDANFHMQYRHMVPLVERELRVNVYGAKLVLPHLSDGERDRFSLSEVAAAAAVLPELHGRRGSELDARLAEQWAAVRRAEEAERALRQQADLQREHMERLRVDRRRLREFMPALLVRRELRGRREQEAAAAATAARQRGATIRAYVAEHALEAQSRLDMAWSLLGRARARVGENALRIAGLEGEVRDLCARAGVRDPEHAYAILMGVASDDDDDDGDKNTYNHHNNNNNNNGGGGGGGNVRGDGHRNAYAAGGVPPLGPWSASSLGRVEEEYDRFLADMQMRDARNGGGIYGAAREGRSEDDRTRDSGVAGMGRQDYLYPPHL